MVQVSSGDCLVKRQGASGGIRLAYKNCNYKGDRWIKKMYL